MRLVIRTCRASCRRLRNIASMCVGRQWRSRCWWSPRSLLRFSFFCTKDRLVRSPLPWKKASRCFLSKNLSSDKENAYFTDGVQDEILTDLAKIADLKVISRTSVMQYQTGAPRNLREI